MTYSKVDEIPCRHCGLSIVGVPETKHGFGWVHQSTNRESCGRGPSTFAEPSHGPVPGKSGDLARYRGRAVL